MGNRLVTLPEANSDAFGRFQANPRFQEKLQKRRNAVTAAVTLFRNGTIIVEREEGAHALQ